ncbi:MAG: hypothetical protein F6K30_19175 [Cyanothece sp. SIO2G6]|nr:hypothetical protein [Cyanothece sp. SIO2G6]
MPEEISDTLNEETLYEETLSLITYTPVSEPDTSKGTLSSVVSGTPQSGNDGASKGIGRVEVSAKLVEQQMRQLLKTMGGILSRAKQGAGDIAGMELEEVELSVEISAEGKVSLMGVGGTQAGATGAIKLKFGKPKP